MKKYFFITIIILFILALIAFYVEPNTLKVNEYQIVNKRIDSSFNGLKVIHFSDTLLTDKSNYDNLDNLVKSINDLNPDIVIFTGDLINKKVSNKNEKKIINALKDIKVKYYKYAIKGNKDPKNINDIFIESNFIYLDNQAEYLFINGKNPIMISGNITDKSTIINYNENIISCYNIALLHKPDDVDKYLDSGYDLYLAGHSLGGQIRIPFYKPIITFEGSKKYTSEKHEFENSILYTSYGIGTLKYNARLFNKPSFNVYRLYNK